MAGTRLPLYCLAAALGLSLAACGSISIPLGSFAKSDDSIATGSITPAIQTGKVASVATTADKPFTLDAPADSADQSAKDTAPATTGSIEVPASAIFDKNDHAAVLAALGTVLPDKGKASSQSWSNDKTGHNGLIVPMAQIGKTGGSCRELLISFVKGRDTDWLKGEGCKVKPGEYRLSAVTPWRQTH